MTSVIMAETVRRRAGKTHMSKNFLSCRRTTTTINSSKLETFHRFGQERFCYPCARPQPDLGWPECCKRATFALAEERGGARQRCRAGGRRPGRKAGGRGVVWGGGTGRKAVKHLW